MLPWITYLTPVDTADSVTLGAPTTHPLTLTNPKLPGLKIEIPAGTTIHGYTGQVVHRLSLTPLRVTRTPFPWAPDMVPQYFSLQPGDATVSGPGLRIIYPNASNQPPGAHVPYLVESPDWPGTGWWRYGTGHVTANGRSVVPDPGTVYHKILPGGDGTGDNGCETDCPPPGSSPNGEPVDLASGLYIYEQTDLTLPGPEGAWLTRTYRQLDDDIYDFGVGMSDDFNEYIDAASDGNYQLFLPDGSYITYTPTATTGVYDAVGSPTGFVGSVLTMGTTDTDGPFSVALKDGTTLAFGNPAFLTKMTDRYGNSVTINRIEDTSVTAGGGQIQTVTTSSGRWLKFTYGVCVVASTPSDCVTQVEDNSGRTVSYAYDANGRLTKVTDPGGGTTTYTWAPCSSSITCSEILSVTDPDGNTFVTNSYDPTSGLLTGQTQADGGSWSYHYTTNGGGQITQASWTNPLGTNYSESFDAAGYPTSATAAVGTSSAETTDYAYDPTSNLLTSQTDALGRTTSYSYDALGNVTAVTSLSGTSKASTYSFTYDPSFNRLTSITNPLGKTTTIAYDDAAHTETITDPLGHQTSVHVNDEGQPVSITDPLGNTTYLSYLNGDLVGIANPLGEVTDVYYSSVGQPLEVTDPEGNVTDYSWTPLNEEASTTDPLGDETSYQYDADGNLTALTDVDGRITTFAYDSLGDLIKEVDPLGRSTTYSYDTLGDVVGQKDRDGTVTKYTYNPLDLLSKARYGVSGVTDQSSITYSYDAGNRLKAAVDSAAGTYKFTYDGLNDVLTATAPQGKVVYTYDVAGLRTSMTVPGQAKTQYTYNPDELLTKVAQGASTATMSYDADSRPTSLTLPDGINESTTYDAASEPSELDYTNGATSIGTLDYGYNDDGLITSVSGSLATADLPGEITSATYNADNELTDLDGTALTYDKDGNLLTDGTNTYGWNARGELATISGGTTASFVYDPFGRQAQSTIDGTPTANLYDGTSLVQELSGTTPTANFLSDGLGDELQTTTSSGASSYLTDVLGSTVALANSSGQLTTRYSYTPEGQATVSGASSSNPFQFAGSEASAAGLDVMGARDYDPAIGTFTSQDPSGFDGGTSNLYSYAGEDPVNFTDPSGLIPRRHRPSRIGRGRGTAPTPPPSMFMFSVTAGGGSSPPPPAPTPPQGDTSGNRQSGNGGDGGGACTTVSISVVLAFEITSCSETLPNGQPYSTTSEGVGISTPGVSVEGGANETYNVTNPQEVGGGGVSCSVGGGEGLEGGVSYSQSSGVESAGVDTGYGAGPLPVYAGCYGTLTQVSTG